MDLEQLKFPVGKYLSNKNPNKDQLKKWINDIETFPMEVEKLVKHNPSANLNWKYRPNGWMIKQVIHHCADSHINSLVRFKLALTENTPVIRPYYEDKWANLVDSLNEDVSGSIQLLKGLHKKWTNLLNSLTEEQLQMEFIHPEHGTRCNLAENIGIYAWHCKHHLRHIENGINSKGIYN